MRSLPPRRWLSVGSVVRHKQVPSQLPYYQPNLTQTCRMARMSRREASKSGLLARVRLDLMRKV